MSGPGKLLIQGVESEGSVAPNLVMAWASDVETGEPRFILELDAAHKGSKCGCVCPSCGLPLTAVNAAKTEFLRRPHFRHPEGSERNDCLVLAARAAALRRFQNDGWLDLPRRQRTATVTGLSGKPYHAWVEAPPQRLHILKVDYRDRAAAVITFDDGRSLRVELTGTPGDGDLGADGLPVPTIFIGIDDPTFASMTAEELRQRMRLLPDDALCWRGHWDDQVLMARAEADARAKAHFYFDSQPDDLVLPDGLDPALRRETVLHHEVKAILAEERHLWAPGVDVQVDVPAAGGRTLSGQWREEPHELMLDRVELEQRFGRIVPDIRCKSTSVDGTHELRTLLIEVTVTNPIDDERLTRISEHGQAALEIDLSRAGGQVTRAELKRLVVEELSIKRWLFHPEADEQRSALQTRLTNEAGNERIALEEQARRAAERRRRVLDTPLAEIAREYLDAVVAMLDADVGDRHTPEILRARQVSRERLADAADKLGLHGFREATDEYFISQGGILARILSCQLRRPVGYRLDNVMSVLNAARQMRGHRRMFVSLALIAARVYRPDLTSAQQEWLDLWAEEVKASIRARETTYLRDPVYDRLLSQLFPEMADALAKPFGKRSASDRAIEAFGTHDGRTFPGRRSADFIQRQPRADSARCPLLDTRPGDWWLKGRDLEAWKKANPTSAQMWFGEPSQSAET